MSDSAIKLKSSHNSANMVTHTDPNITLEKLNKKVRKLWQFDSDQLFTIKWIDDEGDPCLLTRREDLDEMLYSNDKWNSKESEVVLHVFNNHPMMPGMPCPGEDGNIYRRDANRWLDKTRHKTSGNIYEHKCLKLLFWAILLWGSFVEGVPTRRTNFCYKNITQPTRCLYLSHPTFLELELPYKAVAMPEYLPGLKITGEEIIKYSQRWLEVKKTLPKCWPDLQVALAAVLMPQCDEDPNTGQATKIYQPSYDICNDLVNRNNCRFLERHYGWLPIFNCSDTNLYTKNCTHNLRELKSHSIMTTNLDSCKYPLVPSNDSKLWFKDAKGCAMHCKYPIWNPQDHNNISTIIEMFGMIGLISTSLAVVLYVVNNRKPSRMAEVTRQCTLCHLMVYLGWLMQFVYNQEIACSSNGATLSVNSRLCIMTFFLTYAPSLASLLWCAYLAKLCFEKLTGMKKKSDSKSSAEIGRNIYLFCYGTPLSLFIIVSLIGEIESHGLYGICTVGQQSNMAMKLIFLHAPTVIGVFYENFYFIRTLYKLRIVKDKNQRLKRNLTRIMALATLSAIHLVSSIGRHIYELKNHDRLVEAVDKYLACSLNLDKVNDYDYQDYNLMRPECTINIKPMTMIYYVELISTLSIGTVIASWAFCEANFRSLRKKLVDMLEDDKDLERKFCQRANSGVVAEFEETYHDVIDVTTPTQRPREIELDENVDQPTRQNLDTDEASLGSISISKYFLNASTNKRRKNAQFHSDNRTSRDVINSHRQLQQQSLLCENEAELLPAQPPMPEMDPVVMQFLLSHYCQLLQTPRQTGAPEATKSATNMQVGPPPFIGNHQTFVPTRPPWADQNATPQINFTHGVAQRQN